MRLLITGGAGFIGSTLVRMALAAGHEVVVLDALTYAGKRENLPDGVPFRQGRVQDPQSFLNVMAFVCQDGRPFDGVLHLAAESHVDRSIEDGDAFVNTNVLGTQVLLQALHRVAWRGRFVYVSTDEVYGALKPGEPAWTEDAPFKPTSPYAASKASAEHFAMSHHRTYGTDVVITRGSNTYGPRQHVEKLIPLMVLRALADDPLPVYGDGLQQRDWLHVDDHARGILAALEHGRAGQAYNLGGEGERVNLDVVKALLGHLDRPESLISFVTDRLGHDRRYLMDCTRAREELGWESEVAFDEGFKYTVLQLAGVLA
jgi:dTDP-glucose 4,6-dehydratase